jgi:hypothetical protein
MSPGAILPNISLVIESANSQQLISQVKDMLSAGAGQALGATGQGAGLQMNWSKKELAGVQAEYMLAPLGFGLYLAEAPQTSADKNNIVLLSSTELGLSELITLSKNQAAGGSDATTKDLAQVLQQGGSRLGGERLATHVNLASVATLAEQLHASTAMFTGGQPMPEEAQKFLALFKRAGNAGFQVRTSDRALYLETSLAVQ